MKTAEIKFIAVWIDHEKAHLIEPGKEPSIQTVFASANENGHVKGETADGIRLGNFRSTNNEYHKHRKEENQFHQFCKELSAVLVQYDVLLVLGPGTAHKEFRNYLQNEKHFKDKKIMELTTGQMTENELKAKVNSVYCETL